MKEHITDKIKESRGNQIKRIADSFSNNIDNGRKISEVKRKVKRKDETPHLITNSEENNLNNLQEEKIEQDVNKKIQKNVDDEHNVERKTITQLEVKIRTRVKEEGQIPLQWRETSIKSLYKGGGSKEKIQESQRGIFITNIVSKAYEIVKKIQNEAIQSNMSNMHTAGTKNRSTMDNIIIINAIIEKQRQSHKNTYIFFADAEKCFDKLWLKDCLIDMEEIGYSPIRNEQKSRNNSRYNSGSN